MAGESMEIETAEKQLKSLDHSEQHYFNRYVWLRQLFVDRLRRGLVAYRC